MDSLELKVPEQDLEDYLKQIRHISNMDKSKPSRKAKKNKAGKDQRKVTASKSELQNIASRNKKWQKDQNHRPGAGAKNSKYTSNKTHYSPTDPDARISVKPGKARKLNYLSQLSVDTANHVITDIGTYHADKKDNQCLQDITLRLKKRLNKQGILWHNLLADTGYSDGANYQFLEALGIESYIPPHGTYKGGPKGFIYHEEGDYYTCPQGNKISFKKVFLDHRTQTKKKEYRCSSLVCKDCPIKRKCLGKSVKEKRFSVTYYREEYERNNQRVSSVRGKYFKKKRSSTVEPVFGTLTQYMGLRKINTIGIKQANKVMLMAAMAYNLKKYLKFTVKKSKSNKQTAVFIKFLNFVLYNAILSIFKPLKFRYNFI